MALRMILCGTDNLEEIGMTTKEIVTSPIFPPIGIRCFDWAATYDNYEPGHSVGHGATEQEAISDLVEQAEGNAQ